MAGGCIPQRKKSVAKSYFEGLSKLIRYKEYYIAYSEYSEGYPAIIQEFKDRLKKEGFYPTKRYLEILGK